MIMLPSGKSVDVVFCAERGTAFLRRPQLTHHSLAVYTGLEAEIDATICCSIQQVIALVLCVVHAELLADVLGAGVYLQG